jgi:SAM-dependent methyltransferase
LLKNYIKKPNTSLNPLNKKLRRMNISEDMDIKKKTTQDLSALGLNAHLEKGGIAYQDERFDFHLQKNTASPAWLIDKSRHNSALKTSEIKPRLKNEAHLGGNGCGVFCYPNYPGPPVLIAGDPLSWLPRLWYELVSRNKAATVLDVGSGLGYASTMFQLLGTKVTAIEGLSYNVENAVYPTIHHDLSLGPFKPKEKFDIVWCCEVAEHINPNCVDNFLKTIINCRTLALTAAPPGDGGHHHVNCQPQEYWIDKIEQNGLHFDADETRSLRSLAEAYGERKDSHFQRNGMIFKEVKP